MKPPKVLTVTVVTLFSSALAIAPSVAQVRPSYTYPAPALDPDQLEVSGNRAEVLAIDNESTVYGAWDFVYAGTPDNNLFVTRAFANEIGNSNLIVMVLQIDCGRVMFRTISQPILFVDGNESGSPMDIEINEWLEINRNFAFGQAMLRTCEAAAREEGMDWSWL